MPFLQSDCYEEAGHTLCSYTQVEPLAVSDWGLIAGLAIVIALMVLHTVRYILYRK